MKIVFLDEYSVCNRDLSQIKSLYRSAKEEDLAKLEQLCYSSAEYFHSYMDWVEMGVMRPLAITSTTMAMRTGNRILPILSFSAVARYSELVRG